MAVCLRFGPGPDAIRPGGKTKIGLSRAGFFCAVIAACAALPVHAFAEAVQPVQAPNIPGPTTSTQSGTNPPALQLAGALDLSEGYTTNAGGQQGTSIGKPDTFTRGGIGFGLHYAGAMLTSDLHYTLTGDYYSRFHRLDQLINRLNFTSRAEIVQDHLFLNLTAFATPTALSRVGAISANESSVSNINNRNTYGYIAEPQFAFHIGDYAVSQASVSEGGVFFQTPSTANTGPPLPITPARNSTLTDATEKISSGTFFGRLQWDLTGSYTKMRQTTQSEERDEGTVDAAYALNRVVTLLATAGYERYRASIALTQSLSGPVALSGVKFAYGPTFNVTAEAGVRNRFPAYIGSLHWDITAMSSVEGSLTDSISTPQGNILSNLSTLAASAEGAFSDSQSYYWQTQEQALFPQFATSSPISLNGLALDNSINHERQARLALLHQGERTQFGLSFFGNDRERVSVSTSMLPRKSWVYGARFNVTRKMREDLTGHAGVSYSYANEFGGHDRILNADAGLTYVLGENFDCFLTGRYLHRESRGQVVTNVPLSEVVAIVGIRTTF